MRFVRFALEVAVMVPAVRLPTDDDARYELTILASVTVRFVVVAFVVVAFKNVCPPVHVFTFVRLSEATTAPDAGEMVSVPSTFDTDVTAPEPAQLPSGSWKHPPESRIPLAKVEVAVPVWLMAATLIPPAKVEVALEVAVRTPVVRLPMVVEEKLARVEDAESALMAFGKITFEGNDSVQVRSEERSWAPADEVI